MRKLTILNSILFLFGILPFASAQTAMQLPKKVSKHYVDYLDNSISDEFDGAKLDTEKWTRRDTGGPVITNFSKDESLVKMESEKSDNGKETHYVSIKGVASDGPLRTAGIVSKASGYYGFYVVRFRYRGFDTPDVKEKGSVWHPSVWSALTNHNDDLKKTASPKNWLEIDFMEWENGANGWSSDAPARLVDSKGVKRKVVTHGQGAEKGIMKGVTQKYDSEWQTIGLEYAPEHLKLWQWADGKWTHIGDRVVAFVEEDTANPESSYTLNTIGDKARQPSFWVLGNIIARYIQKRIDEGTNTHTINDLALDFDFFRYYRHKSAEHLDWAWENEKPNGGGKIKKDFSEKESVDM
ncbi:hypothetical protein V6R21_01120 [Limibacter armeniacum]|uniref:hypothetical protein n=1 Tax=Limibacter armeniacum TaxID=466084 RepID=UPI002FE57A70